MGNDLNKNTLRFRAPLFRPNGPGRVTWRCAACGAALASDGAEAALARAAPGVSARCQRCGARNAPPESEKPAAGRG